MPSLMLWCMWFVLLDCSIPCPQGCSPLPPVLCLCSCFWVPILHLNQPFLTQPLHSHFSLPNACSGRARLRLSIYFTFWDKPASPNTLQLGTMTKQAWQHVTSIPTRTAHDPCYLTLPLAFTPASTLLLLLPCTAWHDFTYPGHGSIPCSYLPYVVASPNAHNVERASTPNASPQLWAFSFHLRCPMPYTRCLRLPARFDRPSFAFFNTTAWARARVCWPGRKAGGGECGGGAKTMGHETLPRDDGLNLALHPTPACLLHPITPPTQHLWLHAPLNISTGELGRARWRLCNGGRNRTAGQTV